MLQLSRSIVTNNTGGRDKSRQQRSNAPTSTSTAYGDDPWNYDVHPVMTLVRPCDLIEPIFEPRFSHYKYNTVEGVRKRASLFSHTQNDCCLTLLLLLIEVTRSRCGYTMDKAVSVLTDTVMTVNILLCVYIYTVSGHY